jgi:hypothetical protein
MQTDVNMVYTFGSIVCFAMIWLSYKKSPLVSAEIIWGCSAYLGFRQTFRLLDFEGTKKFDKGDNYDVD